MKIHIVSLSLFFAFFTINAQEKKPSTLKIISSLFSISAEAGYKYNTTNHEYEPVGVSNPPRYDFKTNTLDYTYSFEFTIPIISYKFTRSGDKHEFGSSFKEKAIITRSQVDFKNVLLLKFIDERQRYLFYLCYLPYIDYTSLESNIYNQKSLNIQWMMGWLTYEKDKLSIKDGINNFDYNVNNYLLSGTNFFEGQARYYQTIHKFAGKLGLSRNDLDDFINFGWRDQDELLRFFIPFPIADIGYQTAEYNLNNNKVKINDGFYRLGLRYVRYLFINKINALIIPDLKWIFWENTFNANLPMLNRPLQFSLSFQMYL